MRELEVNVVLRLDGGDDAIPDVDAVRTAVRRTLEGETIYWSSAEEVYPPAKAGPCAVIDEATVAEVAVDGGDFYDFPDAGAS
jgi:hypothetical protein